MYKVYHDLEKHYILDQMTNTIGNQSRSYLEIILLSVAIIVGYIWLQVPFLEQYSLQGFAMAILIYFGIKTVATHRPQLLPKVASFELVPLIFALLILVGSTDASQSSYFGLLYIFLLLLVLTSTLYGAIILTSELVFVLYALSVQLEMSDWRQLLSLPLMLGFFLYIKHQLNVSDRQREQLAESASVLEEVSQKEMTLERFVGTFLRPKLQALGKLGDDPQTTKQLLLSQLDLLENEIDKVLTRNNAETENTRRTEAAEAETEPAEIEPTNVA